MTIQHASISGYLKRAIFTPPYRLLPLVVFAFLVFSFIYHPQSALRNFQLLDPDDYMRLNQLINWLQGGSWYDLSHPRLSPGEGVVVRWSRLVDVPLAAIAWPLMHFIKMEYAVMIAALIVPVLLLGVLMLPAVTAMVRPFVPRQRANMAAVMLAFALVVVIDFTPGRVDHHGYQMAIAAFGFAGLFRIWLCANGWRAAIATALAFACGLWIGGEIVPCLAIFAACLVFMSGWRGGFALRNAAVFGACLSLFTIIILPLARLPGEWGRLEITWFSAAYVIFAIALGNVFVIGWALGRHTGNRFLRLSLLLALSFAAAMAFFYVAPKAIEGPFADLEILSSKLILENVGEAQPMWDSFNFNKYTSIHDVLRMSPLILRYFFLPLLGLAVIIWNSARLRGRRCAMWIAAGCFLVPMFLLTMFWQKRALAFTALFSIVPVTWLFWAWMDRIGKTLAGRPRFWAEILAFCSLSVFPVALIPLAATGKPVFPDVLLFPANRPKEGPRLDMVAEFLAAPTGCGNSRHTIMNGINEGPELLFRTPHNVISAPYNVRGNRDAFDFFSARDDETALGILRRRGADLVLIGRSMPRLYATINSETRWKASLSTGKDGKLNFLSNKDRPTLVERLARGNNPSWLKPIEVMFNKDYLLYEVELPETANEKNK